MAMVNLLTATPALPPRFLITSNRGGLVSGFTDGIVHLDLGYTVSVAEINFYSAGTRNLGVGLWAGPSTFLTAAVLPSNVIIRKYEMVAGVFTGTTLNSVIATMPTNFSLKITKSGSTVTANVDGVDRVSHTLSSGDQTTFANPTGIGLVVVSSLGSTFDSAQVNGPVVDDFNRADQFGLGYAPLAGATWVEYE